MRIENLFEAPTEILVKNKFGYIEGKYLPDGRYYIDKIYVYPEYRGQGKFSELMKAVPQKAKLLAQPLTVKNEVMPSKDKLIKLYKAHGFVLKPDSNDNRFMFRG